jgi:hypothetical protein
MMVTLTLGELGSEISRRGAIVRRTLRRVSSARALQGRPYINGYMLTLDDATLAAYGVDKALARGIDARYPL